MEIAGVKIESGKIFDLTVNYVQDPPAFSGEDVGRFTFSLEDRVLRFNDGLRLIPLNTTISEDPNLKASLGSNWLNTDLSFNPVSFNDLPGISGLTSNNSLFDVIEQITTNISNLSSLSLNDITVDPGNPDMTVVAHLAGDLILVSIEQVLEGSIISLNFDNLEGFNITDTTVGNMIIFNNDDELISKKVSYKYVMNTASTGHLVTHGLGNQYCAVTCVNPQTDESIIPEKIQYISINELIITLSESLPLVAVVTSFEA